MRHLYVERQIYIRSHGKVQFVSLSPLTQTIFAGIGFFILSWVAFTSVNVVFKAQIIATKQERMLKMQDAYEQRLSDLQTSYDELHAKLIISEERFLANTRSFEQKHRQLTDLLSQSKSASTELSRMRARDVAVLKPSTPSPSSQEQGDSEEASRTDKAASIAQDVFDMASLSSGLPVPQNRTESRIEASLQNLNREQQQLANAVEQSTERQIRKMQSVVAMINLKSVKAPKVTIASQQKAEGGPLIDLKAGEILAGGFRRNPFDRQVDRISQNISTLGELEDFVAKIPLAEPLASYQDVSGFGARKDPFTGRRAFHTGTDLAASYGTQIYSTSSGTVTFAGWKGAYGRLIEIDAGNGFYVRYGHLASIGVKTGQKIAFRDVIGRVGSSGRSTGSHLHYEIWYGGIVRDPLKFIEAGRYVFKKQG